MKTERYAVWVTRPAELGRRTAQVLSKANYDVIEAPIIEIEFIPAARMPAGARPDWLVFVSANAVRGFLKAAHAAGFPEIPHCHEHTRVAVVGQHTAEAAIAAGFEVDLAPTHQDALGLAAALKVVDLNGAQVWIPCGGRQGSATQELPEELRRAGAEPLVFQVYDTVDRQLPAIELARLDTTTPGAILFYSPSAADAVFAPSQPGAVARWRTQAHAIAIGETTGRRLAELGAAQIWVSSEPSDAGVLAVLAETTSRRP